jgi:hypothetical protein
MFGSLCVIGRQKHDPYRNKKFRCFNRIENACTDLIHSMLDPGARVPVGCTATVRVGTFGASAVLQWQQFSF